MKYLALCLMLCLPIDLALSARILAIFPIPAKSHHILFQAVLRTLAERGHEVVSYTPYNLAQPVANYTNVDLEIKSLDDKMTKEMLHYFMSWPAHRVSINLMEGTLKMMENIFENKKIVELIKSDDKFDLVIVEAFYAQEAFLAFGHKFNAPVINIHPFGAHPGVSFSAGSPLNLADIPDFSIPYSDQMSFFQRFYNVFTKLFSLYIYYTKSLPYQQRMMSKIFQDPTLPPIENLIRNISLYINNAHPYVNYPQPYTPNVVPVGGIHLSRGRKSLPPDIKKFLDEADHGVIYFSLGSIIADQLLGKKFFDNFINVFRRLPQKVLWKTNSQYQNLPDNVMTAKWLPQQDILAHPNVVVFLTHGGLFSLHEAVFAGVPVVCIPFFVDQPMNAKFYEAKEVGVRLLFHSLTEETIFSALTTVISNSKYKENMLKLSKIFRDEPQSPADRLVFWVDYVLKHRGAHHLTPTAAGLRWYQLYLLDVVAVLLAVLMAVVAALYFTLKEILRFYSRKRSQFKKLICKAKKIN